MNTAIQFDNFKIYISFNDLKKRDKQITLKIISFRSYNFPLLSVIIKFLKFIYLLYILFQKLIEEIIAVIKTTYQHITGIVFISFSLYYIRLVIQ